MLTAKHETSATKEVLLGPAELSSRLDIYKFTMSQFVFEKFPNAEVKFEFINRGPEKLGALLDPNLLANRLETVRRAGFNETELYYLSELKDSTGRPRFSPPYVDFLRHIQLPAVDVGVDGEGELQISTTGDWSAVTLWETVILSQVNEMIGRSQVNHLVDAETLYDQGYERLWGKIQTIKDYNDALPAGSDPIRFIDFGTRRHHSPLWHEAVVQTLRQELGRDVFLGTSNVRLARDYDLPAVGTFAHEMIMVYGALASDSDLALRQVQTTMLNDWEKRYPDLTIALSDTFGTEAFFEDFARSGLAQRWAGVRQDSGDPFEFAQKTIDFYNRNGINPRLKQVIFSDGLDEKTIIALHKRFSGKIKVGFGWGTNLTNDLGLPSLSIVMKATSASGRPTVKLSDNIGKALGPAEEIARYRRVWQNQ